MQESQIKRDVFLADNTALLEYLRSDSCSPALHPHRLCMGGAAMSIKADREELVDFLPSYYMEATRMQHVCSAMCSAIMQIMAKSIPRIIESIQKFKCKGPQYYGAASV